MARNPESTTTTTSAPEHDPVVNADKPINENPVAEGGAENNAEQKQDILVEEKAKPETVGKGFTFPPSNDYNKMLDGLPNKSARIRRMHADGYKTTQIAKHLNILYQHARNVLTQVVKRPTEAAMPQGEPNNVVQITNGKLAEIAESQGLSPEELADAVRQVTGMELNIVVDEPAEQKAAA